MFALYYVLKLEINYNPNMCIVYSVYSSHNIIYHDENDKPARFCKYICRTHLE
jgi:hypothetical protein